jgi:hypothetical protein
MDTWVSLISSVGFPIVAACALFYFMWELLKSHKMEMQEMRKEHREEVSALEQTLRENTAALIELRDLIHERITS